MNIKIFCLRDRKADCFGRPVFCASIGLLVRELQDAVHAGADALGKHPEDFAVYALGEFDDVKGSFKLLPLPDLVLEVSSLLPPAGRVGPEGAAASFPVKQVLNGGPYVQE